MLLPSNFAAREVLDQRQEQSSGDGGGSGSSVVVVVGRSITLRVKGHNSLI